MREVLKDVHELTGVKRRGKSQGRKFEGPEASDISGQLGSCEYHDQ